MNFKSECCEAIKYFINNYEHIPGFKEYVTANNKTRILHMASLNATLELFDNHRIKDIINNIEEFSICQRMIEFASIHETKEIVR
jgi:cell division protein ZapA (FtsZ GTPase activity inhibitor)